jgi:hypothetical protein
MQRTDIYAILISIVSIVFPCSLPVHPHDIAHQHKMAFVEMVLGFAL